MMESSSWPTEQEKVVAKEPRKFGLLYHLTEFVLWELISTIRVDETQECQDIRTKKCVTNGYKEDPCRGSYAKGAVCALQRRGNTLKKGIIGCISGSEGLDSSGFSSSAAKKEHRLIKSPKFKNNLGTDRKKAYKILLAFSGLKHALTNNPGYNSRVAECQEAAECFYSSQPLMDLYEIMLKAPGVYGARFSGACFRGCCIGLVDADQAEEAASFVRHQYQKLIPKLGSQIKGSPVLICAAGHCARVI